MGNSQSSSLRSIYKSFNQNLTEIINSASTSANANQVNQNIINFKVGAGSTFNNCPALSSYQRIDASQTLRTIAKFQSAQQLQTILSNTVNQTASNSQDAVNDFLSLGFNSQKSSTQLVSDITNIINTKINNSNALTCNVWIDNINTGNFELGENITYNCTAEANTNPKQFYQEIFSTQMADCISNTFIDIIKSDETINSAIQEIENKQKAENKGLSSFLGSLMGPLIIIAVIIVLVLIAKTVLTKKSSPATSSMGEYGSSMGRGSGVSFNYRM